MNLYLGAEISQMFWRLVYPGSRSPGWPSSASSLPQLEDSCACNSSEVRDLAPVWVEKCLRQSGARLDVLTFDRAKRRDSEGHVASSWCTRLPEGSFFDLGNGVYVSSPCFTFLQMAKRLSALELIAYGDEICGVYAFDKESPRGMRQRDVPLVTLADLVRYLDGAVGCPGVKSAQTALRFVVENSASPMETVDEMLLCLPFRLGGYSLSTPTMNLEIPLGDLAARIAGKRTCRGDLSWPGDDLIVEHQGLFDHSQTGTFEGDRARIDALKAEGYNVLELTTGIVHDLQKFEGIALYVARTQGKQIRQERRGPIPQRLALRESLFGWNERSGLPKH